MTTAANVFNFGTMQPSLPWQRASAPDVRFETTELVREESSQGEVSSVNQGGATTRTSKEYLVLLEQVYNTRDPAAVFAFLEGHPFLVSLLIEAHAQVSRFFPSFVGFLEVHTDPDDTLDKQLVFFIATNLSAEDAFSRLDQLDEYWWLDATEHAQGKLCIMLEV